MDTPFELACKAKGGLSALAASIGRSKQAVNHYKSGVPEDMAPLIEQQTGVRCEELCPHVVWVRGAPSPEWPNGKPLIDKTVAA